MGDPLNDRTSKQSQLIMECQITCSFTLLSGGAEVLNEPEYLLGVLARWPSIKLMTYSRRPYPSPYHHVSFGASLSRALAHIFHTFDHTKIASTLHSYSKSNAITRLHNTILMC